MDADIRDRNHVQEVGLGQLLKVVKCHYIVDYRNVDLTMLDLKNIMQLSMWGHWRIYLTMDLR